MTLPLGWCERKDNDGRSYYERAVPRCKETLAVEQAGNGYWRYVVYDRDGKISLAEASFETPELAALAVLNRQVGLLREEIDNRQASYNALTREISQLAYDALREEA